MDAQAQMQLDAVVADLPDPRQAVDELRGEIAKMADAKRTHDCLRVLCAQHGTPIDEQSPCGEDIVLWAGALIDRLRKEADEAKLIAQGVEEGAAEWESDCKEAQARVAELEAEQTQIMAALDRIEPKVERVGKGSDDLIAALDRAHGRADTSEKRATKLATALRSIAHVDKTPMYGYSGTKADKDRRGQLPKKPGQRWKTPREIVRDMKLPEPTTDGTPV